MPHLLPVPPQKGKKTVKLTSKTVEEMFFCTAEVCFGIEVVIFCSGSSVSGLLVITHIWVVYGGNATLLLASRRLTTTKVDKNVIYIHYVGIMFLHL
jgi:hypothetical protein